MRPAYGWFYVGDGQSGVWRWLWARFFWRVLPWRFAPRMPDGWAWNVTKGGRETLYARHDS